MPPSSAEGASTTDPRVCNAFVSAAAVTSGVSGSRMASDSTIFASSLFLDLMDRTRQRWGILDDGVGAPRERDLEHRLVG